MIKEKKSLKVTKTPSRRKFFKVAAAALKNLRLEGVLVTFSDFLSLTITSPYVS